MTPVTFYDSGLVEKSAKNPIAIALQILYNTNIEYFDHWDLPASCQGRSFHFPFRGESHPHDPGARAGVGYRSQTVATATREAGLCWAVFGMLQSTSQIRSSTAANLVHWHQHLCELPCSVTVTKVWQVCLPIGDGKRGNRF